MAISGASSFIEGVPDAGNRRSEWSNAAIPLRSDPFRFCLLALIVFSLSRLSGYFGILRVLRPALLLFAFCVLYAFLHRRKLVRKNLSRSVAVRLILGLGVVAVGSAVFGISLGHSATYILNDFSKTLAITFLVIAMVRDVHDVRRLCWAFALGGVVLAYLSVFVVGISKTTGGVSYDANDIGVFMVMSIPLALLLMQTSTGRFEKAITIASLTLLVTTVVKTQSRGAFIGSLVIGIVLVITLPGVSIVRRFLLVGAAALTMTLAAPAGYWDSMRSILEDPKTDYNWDAVNGRRNLARRGIGYMMAYPVFGVGIDNFRIAEGTISDKALHGDPGKGIRWASPHNSFIQAGAEGGVLGLVLWVSLVISNIVIPLRLRSRMPRSFREGTAEQRFLSLAALCLPITQLGFAVTGFFVAFAWMEPLYFLTALVTGLSIVTKRALLPYASPAVVPGFRTLRWRSAQTLVPNTLHTKNGGT